MCGALDCAVFVRFYTRQAVDEFGTFFSALPIAVFLCRGKGKRNGPHKYFSLLPHVLVPYSKYSIPFVMHIARQRFVNKLTFEKIFEEFDVEGLNLCPATLRKFFSLVYLAIEKLLVSKYSHDLPDELLSEDVFSRVKAFLSFADKFVCAKTNTPIRGPCALALDFYLSCGGFSSNAQFLFGTPSQFRGKK